jgi:hypothetical protein
MFSQQCSVSIYIYTLLLLLFFFFFFFSFGVLQLMLPEAPQSYGLLYYPCIGLSNFYTSSALLRPLSRKSWSCNPALFIYFQPSPLVVFERSQQPKVEISEREMAGKFILKTPDFHVAFRDLLHAINLRHGTHDFTSLPKEGMLRIFYFRPEKSDGFGFEPRELGF